MNVTAIDSTLQRHVTCIACGYDLFAAPEAGACPECGKQVSASIGAGDVLSDPSHAAAATRMSRSLLVSSIFAGLCPASCLLALMMENIVGPVLMTVAFGVCACFGFLAERERWPLQAAMGAVRQPGAQRPPVAMPVARPENDSPIAGQPLDYSRQSDATALRPLLLLDLFAAIGLVLINLAAYAYLAMEAIGSVGRASSETIVSVPLGVGFFFLSITAWRALPAWRMQAALAKQTRSPKLAQLMTGLGWTKAIYETLWLTCCWMPFLLSAGRFNTAADAAVFFALGAFFGLFGFAVIWILMIISHGILSGAVRRHVAITHPGNAGHETATARPHN